MKTKRPTLTQVRELQERIRFLENTQELPKRIKFLEDLHASSEVANIERQGKIEKLQASLATETAEKEELRKRCRTLEADVRKAPVKTQAEVFDYSLVPEELLAELGRIYLDDSNDGEQLQELVDSCKEASKVSFDPHPQQPIVIDEHGRKRFRANSIVRRLVDECKQFPMMSIGATEMNYIATFDASREDRAQLAQLIGYSVDGYQSLSYALPVKDEES